MTTRSNNTPQTFWHRVEMACGTVRHRLFVNGEETALFVDDSRRAGHGHRSMGYAVSLYGSGMGPEIKRQDYSTYRIAAFLGGFKNVGQAKARAELKALA